MWKLAEDTLDHTDFDELAAWLKTYPQVTQGPLVKQFEKAWAAWAGVEHAVMVSSGTAANFALVACAARKMQRQRLRVGVAAVTWSTNISPSMLLGHEITVFDVMPTTLGIDTAAVRRAIVADQLDMLFVTHLLGFNGLDADTLRLARDHGVLVLEDCCEAHGAMLGSKKVGSLGLGGTFSFYFGHHMSTIEGGMITTHDAQLADDLRLMRAHGLARESVHFAQYAEQHPHVDKRFLFMQPGLNFRSTELNAFLGLRQLELLDKRVNLRNANLRSFLAGLPDGYWRSFKQEGASSYALPLIAEDEAHHERAKRVIAANGIESRPVVAGNLLQQPMLKDYPVKVAPGGTPVADHIHRWGLYVGNGHHVDEAKIARLLADLGGTRGAV